MPPRRPHAPTGLRRPVIRPASGFTLVELLTVIAIIGVLAAIMIPVVGSVRERAKAANCATNLRQTGVAIQTYISDNKGYLPPVGHLGIAPYFNADTRNFQYALLPYLSVAKSGSWSTSSLAGMSYSPTLDCPGFKGTAGKSCFSIRETVTTADGEPLIPWGRIYQVGSQFLLTRKPTKHSLVPPNAEAIIDRIPTPADAHVNQPNHSGFQNALYFDWHVGRVPTAN